MVTQNRFSDCGFLQYVGFLRITFVVTNEQLKRDVRNNVPTHRSETLHD